MEKQKCKGYRYDHHIGSIPCMNNAHEDHDGYCRVCCPKLKAERQAARDAKWRAKYDAKQLELKRAELKRKAEADSLALLDLIMHCHFKACTEEQSRIGLKYNALWKIRHGDFSEVEA